VPARNCAPRARFDLKPHQSFNDEKGSSRKTRGFELCGAAKIGRRIPLPTIVFWVFPNILQRKRKGARPEAGLAFWGDVTPDPICEFRATAKAQGALELARSLF